MNTSYKKFASLKEINQVDIIISTDSYKEHLLLNFSGLALKNSPEFVDAIKKSYDINQIKNELHSVSYPEAEAIIIALNEGSSEGQEEHLQKLERWVYRKGKNDSVCKLVENMILDLQGISKRKTISPDQIDKTINSFVEKGRNIAGELAFKIENIIKQTGFNFPVQIELLLPENDILPNSMRVTLGEEYKTIFDVTKKNNSYDVHGIQFDEMPQSVYNQMQILIDKIKESPKIGKILSLYMSQPKNNRNLFEKKKRDISLGIKAHLNEGTLLSNLPNEENDVWKVKIDNVSISEKMREGDYILYQIHEDANIRWIELLRSKNER